MMEPALMGKVCLAAPGLYAHHGGNSTCGAGLKGPTVNHAKTLQRLKPGVEHLHTLGPRVTAEMLADLASRIGGLPAILGLLAEYQRLTPQSVVLAGADRFPPPALRVVPCEVQQ
jgi:hypothetical protein